MGVNTLRLSALNLYKNLFKYGRSLQLTDKEYFLKRVRQEFQQNKELSEESLIKHQISKGESCLKLKRLL